MLTDATTLQSRKLRVTNSAAYDAALRQRSSLMGQSTGCFEVKLKGRPGRKDSPKYVYAASCEGDDGLVVAFSLASFAVIGGAAVVVSEQAECVPVERAQVGQASASTISMLYVCYRPNVSRSPPFARYLEAVVSIWLLLAGICEVGE